MNSTYKLFPEADVLYGGDFQWWKFNHQQVKATFKGQCWTQAHEAAERYKLHRIRGSNRNGLGHERVHLNGNSGFQAINLAYLFGCRRILLVGFDMQLGPKGEKHWHPDHPAPMVQGQTFSQWIHFGATLAKDLVAAGCIVVNCSAQTALTCFRRGNLEEELQWPVTTLGG